MTDRSVMTADDVRRTLVRLGHEIVERHGGTDGLVIVGIQRRGAVLARRIATEIARSEGVRLPVGTIDISLYRDDLSEVASHPIVRPTELPFELHERTVILVDDVLFTGRTVRAAMDSLVDHGRPGAIRLVVLIDRGHRELPIRPDHIGRTVPSSREERVNVHVEEIDGDDGVAIGQPVRPGGAAANGSQATG